MKFKTTEVFVVYANTFLHVSTPREDLIFTTPEEAEEYAKPLKEKYPDLNYTVGTLEECIEEYSDYCNREGYNNCSENM